MTEGKTTVTKLEAELNRLDAAFHCSECNGQFTYGPGYPDFCPECGEEFDSTDSKRGETR